MVVKLGRRALVILVCIAGSFAVNAYLHRGQPFPPYAYVEKSILVGAAFGVIWLVTTEMQRRRSEGR